MADRIFEKIPNQTIAASGTASIVIPLLYGQNNKLPTGSITLFAKVAGTDRDLEINAYPGVDFETFAVGTNDKTAVVAAWKTNVADDANLHAVDLSAILAPYIRVDMVNNSAGSLTVSGIEVHGI